MWPIDSAISGLKEVKVPAQWADTTAGAELFVAAGRLIEVAGKRTRP
mgnify:CR=1 FL=1